MIQKKIHGGVRFLPAQEAIGLLSAICLFLFFFASSRMVQAGLIHERIDFQHLTVNEGLSENSVNSIIQDEFGFLWFATNDGLNRYDGYSFEVYRYDVGDTNSLRDNYIRILHKDPAHGFWIGTRGAGLSHFNPMLQRFIHYLHDPNDPGSLSNNLVNAICVDGEGWVWVGTEIGGLNRLDPVTRRFIRYKNDPENSHSLSSNTVASLYHDSSGRIWIGTSMGLNLYDPAEDRFIRYVYDPDNPASLSPARISDIKGGPDGKLWLGHYGGGVSLFDPLTGVAERFSQLISDPENQISRLVQSIWADDNGILWIGTLNGGLYRFDYPRREIETYRHDPRDLRSISGNHVRTLFRDRSGNLWIGTWSDGLNRYFPPSGKFKQIEHDPLNPAGLSGNRVYTFAEDERGFLWIGTYGAGLNRYDPDTGKYRVYRHNNEDPNSISSDNVYSLQISRAGGLWVGTWGAGLDYFDPGTGRFAHYGYDPLDPRGIPFSSVVCILEDSKDRLWIGTFGGGLACRLKGETGFRVYKHDGTDTTSLGSSDVMCLLEDSDGEIWIGTWGGCLNRFAGGAFERIYIKKNPKDLYSNSIASLWESSDGMLWLGTRNSGIYRYDRKTRTLYSHESLPIPNPSIQAITEDGNGHIWFSTNRGITRLNPTLLEVSNFDVSDGLQSNQFNSGAVLRRRNGELLFGGIKGYNVFHPDSIPQLQPSVRVILTELLINNIPVEVGRPVNGRMILRKAITSVDTLILTHRERVFTLGFSALEFNPARKIDYAYRMEGFDKDWNHLERMHYATYTNLPHGKYIFHVKAYHGFMVNSIEARLFIRVLPPFWLQSWFLLFFGLVTVGALTAGYRWKVSRYRRNNRLLAQRVAERTGEIRTAYWELQQEVAQRKNAEKKSRRREAHSELIYSIGQRISTCLDTDTLLAETAKAIQDAFRYDNVMVLMLNEKKNRLELKAISGVYANIFPSDHYILLSEGMIGRAGTTGETQVSGDVRTNPYYITKASESSMSELSIPLKNRHGRLLGVLDLQSDHPDEFDPSDVILLETLSIQVVSAIENAALYEKAQSEIRERKKADKALRQSEKKYRDLFGQVADPVFIIDEEFQLLDCNDVFAEMFGCSKKILEKQKIHNFLQDPFPSMIGSEFLEPVVLNVKNHAGREIQLEIRSRPIRYEEKKGWLCVARDITRHSELQKELTDFAYVVSHDLKAPLRAVSQLAKWLASDYRDRFDEEGKEQINLLISRVKRMDNLIDGVLRYSRAGRVVGEIGRLDLNELVADLVGSLAPPSRIKVEIQGRLPRVKADRIRLEQVFQNLIGNAIRYIDKPQGLIEIFSKSLKKDWEIHVRDNGPGIEEKYHEIIFQIFQTLQSRDVSESTGVGLSVVKKIVESTGGKVRVESKVGVGSDFIFTIPKTGWQIQRSDLQARS